MVVEFKSLSVGIEEVVLLLSRLQAFQNSADFLRFNFHFSIFQKTDHLVSVVPVLCVIVGGFGPFM